jgi:hypothetical protein
MLFDLIPLLSWCIFSVIIFTQGDNTLFDRFLKHMLPIKTISVLIEIILIYERTDMPQLGKFMFYANLGMTFTIAVMAWVTKTQKDIPETKEEKTTPQSESD